MAPKKVTHYSADESQGVHVLPGRRFDYDVRTEQPYGADYSPGKPLPQSKEVQQSDFEYSKGRMVPGGVFNAVGDALSSTKLDVPMEKALQARAEREGMEPVPAMVAAMAAKDLREKDNILLKPADYGRPDGSRHQWAGRSAAYGKQMKAEGKSDLGSKSVHTSGQAIDTRPAGKLSRKQLAKLRKLVGARQEARGMRWGGRFKMKGGGSDPGHAEFRKHNVLRLTNATEVAKSVVYNVTEGLAGSIANQGEPATGTPGAVKGK